MQRRATGSNPYLNIAGWLYRFNITLRIAELQFYRSVFFYLLTVYIDDVITEG
jgi:hypothetical protein